MPKFSKVLTPYKKRHDKKLINLSALHLQSADQISSPQPPIYLSVDMSYKQRIFQVLLYEFYFQHFSLLTFTADKN